MGIITEIAWWFAVIGSSYLTGAYGGEHDWTLRRTLLLSFTAFAVLVLLRGVS